MFSYIKLSMISYSKHCIALYSEFPTNSKDSSSRVKAQ